MMSSTFLRTAGQSSEINTFSYCYSFCYFVPIIVYILAFIIYLFINIVRLGGKGKQKKRIDQKQPCFLLATYCVGSRYDVELATGFEVEHPLIHDDMVVEGLNL